MPRQKIDPALEIPKPPRNRVDKSDALVSSLKNPFFGGGKYVGQASGRLTAGLDTGARSSVAGVGGGFLGRLLSRSGNAPAKAVSTLLGAYLGNAAGSTAGAAASNMKQDKEFMKFTDNYLPDVFRSKAINKAFKRDNAQDMEDVLDISKNSLPEHIQTAMSTRNPVTRKMLNLQKTMLGTQKTAAVLLAIN